MRNVVGPGTGRGYCTNVHAGADYPQTLDNLTTHTLAVKRKASPGEPMGVGLWLSARTARTLLKDRRVGEFADWLGEHGLLPFTLNGFPFGDFHRDVVKLDVYQPRWDQPERLVYTMDLVNILVKLLGDETEGGISTLPIAWRSEVRHIPGCIEQSADHLVRLADHLARIEADTGKLIHIDIEPEPGCYLDTAHDIVRLFKDHLFARGRDEIIRRHLRVCHDVCHAAVMFEDQDDVLQQYADAGIAVGKVQVSAAVRARLADCDAATRRDMLAQLAEFNEPRYLHQTLVAQPGNVMPTFFADLPEAIEQVLALRPDSQRFPTELRTHFHVPLFLERFGLLESTQDQVLACLSRIREMSDCRHFEAETYAWDVLPAELQADDLADGIVRELQWLREQAPAGSEEPSP